MIGTRLGQWQIEKEIGCGGMGTVYLARNVAPDSNPAEVPEWAAVKLLSPLLAQETGFVLRFRREIEALSTLQHPNIVALFESGEYQGRPYYVMEYVEGPSFDDLLRKNGRMSWDDVIEYGIQICSALKHAHDHGIIHRDLKPTNLLLSKEKQVKLLDFGVARLFSERNLTQANAVVGTAEYLSPEQAAGKPVTRRSDLYSLGVVFYTLLTGRTPFQASTTVEMLQKHRFARFDPPRKYAEDVPYELDDLVCQLMAKDPDDRPPDAAVVARQLERIRRHLARRDQLTTDEVRSSTTLGGTGINFVEEFGSGEPASLAADLARSQARSAASEGPLHKLLNQAWVLIFGLVIILGVLIWGLWPASVEQRLDEVRRLLDRDEWAAASELLDRIEQQYRGHPYHVQVQLYRQRIADREAAVKARWRPSSEGQTTTGEAERFFREAQREYESGNYAKARTIWEKLVAAFDGIESQKEWVEKARAALRKADARDLAAVDEAIRMARNESVPQARRRLQALADLYRDREDDAAKTAVRRIEAALLSLDQRTAGTEAPSRQP
ncbi:MAG: serine/threonine protein kinase [Gemmatales bacterium]|nr:serine/threonine protein kinase [Gemmatales bacterium]MDW8387838.1 serine/threonine-protein kinase [Gemmatales bacterium]